MSTRDEWHGWKREGSDVPLHVGPLPGRKSICLYSIDGSVIRTHAFFRDEQDARDAMVVLESLILPRPVAALPREDGDR